MRNESSLFPSYGNRPWGSCMGYLRLLASEWQKQDGSWPLEARVKLWSSLLSQGSVLWAWEPPLEAMTTLPCWILLSSNQIRYQELLKVQACPEVILLTLNSAPQEIQTAGFGAEEDGRFWRQMSCQVLPSVGWRAYIFVRIGWSPPELHSGSRWPTDLTLDTKSWSWVVSVCQLCSSVVCCLFWDFCVSV